jgi:hypothetical protein
MLTPRKGWRTVTAHADIDVGRRIGGAAKRARFLASSYP